MPSPIGLLRQTEVGLVNRVSRNRRRCPKYLVGGICAQHIQWWGNKLRFDWYGVVTLLLSGPKSPFNGINARRRVARKLDIGTEFDGLWCQATGDRCGEDRKGRGGNWLRNGSEDGFGFAARPVCVSYRERLFKNDTYARASLKAS